MTALDGQTTRIYVGSDDISCLIFGANEESLIFTTSYAVFNLSLTSRGVAILLAGIGTPGFLDGQGDIAMFNELKGLAWSKGTIYESRR